MSLKFCCVVFFLFFFFGGGGGAHDHVLTHIANFHNCDMNTENLIGFSYTWYVIKVPEMFDGFESVR